jgi:hypothetical protein
LSHLAYEERLKILKIPQLEERFDRADLIQMFRLTHNLFPEEVENFCLFSEGRRLRGHEFKVAKESFKTTTRQHFLTNRAFGNWNALPSLIVNAENVSQFKKRYDQHKGNHD